MSADPTRRDLSPKQAARIKNNEEIRPIKRGLYGRFFNWLGMTLTKLLLRVEARGMKNLPDAPYVLAPNHETYVDGMWVGGFLPKHHFKRYACLAAQDLLTDHGAFGRLIMRVGRGIPLNRKGNILQGMKLAMEQVKEGNILMVHPEGTRTRTGRLGRINEGAAFIAKHAQVPIVPVFIDGGYEIFNRFMKRPSFWNKVEKKRRRLIVTYGEPIDPAEYKNTKAMTAALETWLTERYAHKEVPRPNLKPETSAES